jgi:hypothetical protein
MLYQSRFFLSLEAQGSCEYEVAFNRALRHTKAASQPRSLLRETRQSLRYQTPERNIKGCQ